MKSMPPRNKSNAIDKWLKNEIESGSHIGLEWIDDKKQTFRIPWMHASRRQWDVENDASLYKSWAKFKKRYKKGDKNNPRVWKATFRNAINASKYIKFEEKREPNSRIGSFTKPDCQERLETLPATNDGNSKPRAYETRKQINITCKKEFTSPHSVLEDSEDRKSPKGIEEPETSFANLENLPSFELANEGEKVKSPFTEEKYQPETHHIKLKEESEKPKEIHVQVTYYAHAELKEDVSKWNTSAYGYRQSMDIDPMGDAYLHLTDSQCANIDSSNNFNIPAFNWMGSENDFPDYPWLTQTMSQQHDMSQQYHYEQTFMSCWNNEIEPSNIEGSIKMEDYLTSDCDQMPANCLYQF